MNATFAALVLKALVLWTSGSRAHPTEEALRPWADAMASVCMTERQCLEMAAVAVEETHFAAWAVDQSCNDAAWRARNQVHRVCDSGKAFGPWQVQDERFRGASPEFQASVVAERLHRNPRAWTTWDAAQKRAASWHVK